MGESRSFEEAGGLDRRSALRLLSTAAATPFLPTSLFGLPGYHPLVPAVEDDRQWQPRCLEAAELKTVEELAELIIPETETPGARTTLVHQYIDFALSRDEIQCQTVRGGLEWLERECRELHSKRFTELQPDQQIALLERLADSSSGEDPRGQQLFNSIKALTVSGYYRSAAGMHDELGYEGNRYVRRFEGCSHPEHLSWSPDRRRADHGEDGDDGCR